MIAYLIYLFHVVIGGHGAEYPADEQRPGGADDVAELTRQQAAEGRDADDGECVEGHDAAAARVAAHGLHQCVAGDGAGDHAEAYWRGEDDAEEDAARQRKEHHREAEAEAGARTPPGVVGGGLARGHQQGARQRADGYPHQQQPKGLRVAVQDALSHCRHEDDRREGKESRDRDQREEVAVGREAARHLDALPGIAQRVTLAAGLADGGLFHPHHAQRPKGRQVAEAVGEKAEAFAEGVDYESADRRPDHARGVKERRVQRDGVGDVVLTVHHVRDEGVARRQLECVKHTARNGEDYYEPEGDQLCEREESEREGDTHTARL